MLSPRQTPSPTPRTDAAERFFYDSGRMPVGFVSSGLARILEVELGRALAQLHSHGLELPQPPQSPSPQPPAQSPRRPAGSLFKPAAPSERGIPTHSGPTPVPLLPVLAASEALGKAVSYADGEVIYRQGERAEHVFIVLEGQVRVSDSQEGGAERLEGAGQVLAELGMFADGVHRETVHASGGVRVVRLPALQLRECLGPDGSMLLALMLALMLQYRKTQGIAEDLRAGPGAGIYALMSEKTLTGPELHRALVEARAQPPGQGLSSAQLMCLQLQTLEHVPTRLLHAGISLGKSGEEHLGLCMLLVQGKAQARVGEHTVGLGQGSVVGLAEGLTGRDFAWQFSTLEEVNARVFPIDRALQRLERADARLRGLASHLCARIFELQASCL